MIDTPFLIQALLNYVQERSKALAEYYPIFSILQKCTSFVGYTHIVWVP